MHIHPHLTSCNSSSAVCQLIHDYMLARKRYTHEGMHLSEAQVVSPLCHTLIRGGALTQWHICITHKCKHTHRHLMAQSMMLSLSRWRMKTQPYLSTPGYVFFSTPALLHQYFVKAEENISPQVCFCDEVQQVKPSCIHVMSACSNYYPYAVNKRSTSRCTQEQCILYTQCSFSD